MKHSSAPAIEVRNRSAYYEYFIDDKYTAGLQLLGTEVKSIRAGKVSFNDAFCVVHNSEVWIRSLHIAEYTHGNANNHEPLRERKLLLEAKEIKKIEAALKEKGYTLIPLRLFLNEKRFFKLEIGLAKGKKLYDKRESIKSRDNDRELQRYKL